MLLYIHGFNSGVQSPKALKVIDYMRSHFPDVHLALPQLSFCPDQSIEKLSALVQKAQKQGRAVHYLGSSLGAYYATFLRERYGGRAVLINPAVKAYEVLHNFIGKHKNPYTGEEVDVSLTHAKQLQRYDTQALSRLDQYSVYLQTADEVLDYKKAVWMYQGCHLNIEQGGSHHFDRFENHLPEMMNFLNLT
tara:strand:+ start:7012 stop:7587 length:576 start_codon:yes stop_codon:yes gene_type:complete